MSDAPTLYIAGLHDCVDDAAVLVAYNGGTVATPKCRGWCLDSGAFGVANSGRAPLCVEAYTDCCMALMASTFPPDEIFGLDVIGDWRATQRNLEFMWARGVDAIPTFHLGSPEAWLLEIASARPKIALGGLAFKESAGARVRFIDQCFARVWPKKIHGFGVTKASLCLRVPWHSVDSSSIVTNTQRYGAWRAYGHTTLPGVRPGANVSLRAEVDWYLRLECKMRNRWYREMQKL
jgi:hypothetical protein